MSKVYREPGFVCTEPHHRAAAFTMRLLNFLFTLGMKAQARVTPYHVDYYAKRMTDEQAD